MTRQQLHAPIEKIDLLLLLAVIVFFYLLLFKIPFYPFFYEGDQLIFLSNAVRMINGEKMYTDFFQFTFPGGQVLYYLLFLAFGTKVWLLGFVTVIMGALVLLDITQGIETNDCRPNCIFTLDRIRLPRISLVWVRRFTPHT